MWVFVLTGADGPLPHTTDRRECMMTPTLDPSANPEFAAIWARVQPFTMTTVERGFALWTAVNTVVDNGIPGGFVECGVWRGGSSMLIALTLLARGEAHRELFLFDTFSGMSSPGPHDLDLNGVAASDLMQGSHGPEVAELVRAEAPIEAVRTAMEQTGYDMRLVRLVEGDVAETLPRVQTLRIALLRLDTDFYDSTMAELRHLYPRLTRGGIMIIDDYGHWKGAKRAVDEYFADTASGYLRPMLWSIDYTGRGAVKVEPDENVEIERYDYLPPGIDPPDLLGQFPDARAENPWAVNWPYLRPEVPHVWRSDIRNDTPYVTGNASVEEAACLWALARQFAGRRGLEIGSHYGWTAAHLLAAGLELDCIDPEFLREVRLRQVSEALDRVQDGGSYRLWGGFSPAILPEVRASRPEPWSFAFIDGSHDGTAPADDACGVLPHLAPDAVVVFHDLTSPHVEAGLAIFRDAGFQTRLFNTMQVLGVAWRGAVQVFDHVPDPNIAAVTIPHLEKYLRREDASRERAQGPEQEDNPMSSDGRNLIDRLVGRREPPPSPAEVAVPTAVVRPRAVDAPPAQTPVWENLVCLNSDVEPAFSLLAPAAAHRATDARLVDWDSLGYSAALKRDTWPLPETADREGYYGPDHFSYWASGLLDARYLLEAAAAHGVADPGCFLDLGCASGRLLRHMALERPGMRALGCDINRLHVEWCNRHLPPGCTVFQNHSIPTLPLPDNSVDIVSAYSVFTHIEALETAWLMELRRILRPGGIAWITVHSELTLQDMTPDWPLWNPVMLHPEAATKLDATRAFVGDRMVLRWRSDRSYSSNVFYKLDYIRTTWSRLFEIAEVRRRFPSFQDVLILRKPG